MAADEKGLKGLKAYAESSLFSDLKVTPAMKERLRERIRRGEGSRPATVRGPWLTRSVAAVAAVGVLVMVGRVASQPGQEQTRGSAPVAQLAAEQQAAAPQAAAPPAGPAQVTQTARDAAPAARGSTNYDAITITDASGNATVQATEAEPGHKIVRNADYTLEVKEARTALEQLQNLAVSSGGYAVEATLYRGQDGSANGHLVLRVPAGKYGGAIQQVRQVGEVRQEKQWSQDVTERYLDLTARIKIQQQHEQKLTELAQKAATFDDWLKLTKELNDTRATIEQMQGQIKLLSNQVDYSTITITLVQPAGGFTPVPEGSGMWGAMAKAFNRSVVMLGGLGRSFLVGTAASLPFLLPAAVVGAAAVVVVRRRRQRREP